ncbi:MAG: PIN domain-containing protein [Cytophagaceae bacterium]|jgi:predicted nucleic acid-binding protein|nr:PIN domain-containing protein [Cytophagaceae bacterium]
MAKPERVFVDTDIILDLLAKREPYHIHAAALFTLADLNKVELCISPLTYYTISDIVFQQGSSKKSRMNLMKLKTLITFLPVNDRIIELTLTSNFKDFEEGIQYHTAQEYNIKTLITRKLKEYKTAEMTILTAEQYLKG